MTLPESVRGNPDMLRRLHHRIVDIVADGGFVETLANEAESRLGALSSHMAAEYVLDLLTEAHAWARKSKKTRRPKKIAKRGLK
ncbi:MAG: hypothetical protein JSU86_02545 [Phycisphaerales bacterium]|nr:MAG: hypothetical protein JSU86_02545 [Phycisphaerales bacterium]